MLAMYIVDGIPTVIHSQYLSMEHYKGSPLTICFIFVSWIACVSLMIIFVGCLVETLGLRFFASSRRNDSCVPPFLLYLT